MELSKVKNNGIKMKFYLINLTLAIIFIGFIAGCSDMQTNIQPAPVLKSVHKDGFTSVQSPNFHGKQIRENNWDMKTCQQCHAADFSGGLTGKSCLTCHTAPGGPEACNTCHGDFSDPSRIAPPRDINGDTSTTVIGVGAHAQHLYDGKLGAKVACETCHTVPATVYQQGHLDSDLPAEVQLKGLAVLGIASNAAFDPNNATCSNTYCHGNFEFSKSSAPAEDQFAFTADKMEGNNQTLTWNKVDGSQIKCGSCHALPPKGHLGYQQFPISSCSACHQGVVDEYGHIIDPSKHINGEVNVRGN